MEKFMFVFVLCIISLIRNKKDYFSQSMFHYDQVQLLHFYIIRWKTNDVWPMTALDYGNKYPITWSVCCYKKKRKQILSQMTCKQCQQILITFCIRLLVCLLFRYCFVWRHQFKRCFVYCLKPSHMSTRQYQYKQACVWLDWGPALFRNNIFDILQHMH